MPYELDFLQVGDGNGDAISMRYGSAINGYTVQVVDGGFTDTGEKLVRHINACYGHPSRIEHVVLSHADNDHAIGLVKVLENFDVGNLWMNRPWLYSAYIVDSFHGSYTVDGLTNAIRAKHGYLVELESVATQKGIPIRSAFQGTDIGVFRVLAPEINRYVSAIHEFDKTPTSYAESAPKGILASLFEGVKRYAENWNIETLEENPDPTSASNESSIIQIGVLDEDVIVLTADAGPIGLEEAKDYLDSLHPNTAVTIFQVPHHGSRRNVTPTVLNRWLGAIKSNDGVNRGYAYCSLGKNKNDYPRRRVSNAFLRRGFPVYTTKLANVYHYKGFPLRSGYVSISPVPFESVFEE